MTVQQKIITAVVGLIILSALVLLIGWGLARQKTPLLPGATSDLSWFHSIEPATPTDGNAVEVTQSGERSELSQFSFMISPTQDLPYTSYTLYFTDPKTTEDLVDLSAFTGVRFKIQCDPKNILVFALYSFAEGVSEIDRPATYRVNSDFVPCNQQWKEVYFPLRSLDTAIWWVERYGVKYSDREADLQKVHGFAFNNSLQSPRGIQSNFSVKDLELTKEYNLYFFISIAVVVIFWILGAAAITRLYFIEMVKAAKVKINDNLPLIAYQQLSIKQKDESLKTKLLQHISVEYCNPDLNIDGVSEALGTNRTKVNEILKSELGLTFTAYINRLRLTEAARLLTEQQKISVKQIAYEVGFANVTYFNTLFKKEYGCTPKVFASGGNNAD